jgi:hypothetical protein
VTAPTTKSAQQLLDEVTRLEQIEDFDLDGFVVQLRAEVGEAEAGSGVPEQDLAAALAAIDPFAARLMRIRLDHLLISDVSVPPQFRTYLASEVMSYANDLETLRSRVRQVAARVDPDGASKTANAVADAADKALALRSQLRQRIRAIIDERAEKAKLEQAAREEAAEEKPEPSFFELIELD